MFDAFARLIANRANRQSLVTIDTIEPPISGGEVDSNRPLLSGRAPAYSLVSVSVNGSVVGTATATAQSIRCDDRVTAMLAAFGSAHVFDPLATLQALGNGGTDDNNDIAAGLVPRSCLYNATSGQVHLSSTAMTSVAAAIHSSGKIAAL